MIKEKLIYRFKELCLSTGFVFVMIMLFYLISIPFFPDVHNFMSKFFNGVLGLVTTTYYNGAIESVYKNQSYTEFIEPELVKIGDKCWALDTSYDRCIIENVFYLLKNDKYVFDYDNNGKKVCRDKTISYCYILRTFSVDCYPVMTNNHVFSMVKDLENWVFVDLQTMNWVGQADVGDYLVMIR